MRVFDRHWSRRSLLVTMLLAIGGPAVALAQTGPLDSGALGLTRPEIEAQWGVGDGPFAGPGSYFNIYDLYTYATPDATYAVAYQDTNGREIAVYVEIAWASPVSEQEARTVVTGLLPADARVTELYTAPSTPAGATALVAYQYASESLDAAYDNILAGEILVLYQEQWHDDAGPARADVVAASLIVRTITQ